MTKGIGMPQDRQLIDPQRAERIREELRLAAEFSQVPRRAISIARNFRMESLVRLTPPPPCGRVLSPRAAPGVTRLGNPYAQLASPGVLLAAIEDTLKHIDSGGARQDAIALLLKNYGDFAAQATDAAQLKSLQKRVLAAAFGEQYFKHMRGGSAKEHCENR
jgi:hypothetical protein